MDFSLLEIGASRSPAPGSPQQEGAVRLTDFLHQHRLVIMLAGLREDAAQNWIRSVVLVDELEVGKTGWEAGVFPARLITSGFWKFMPKGATLSRCRQKSPGSQCS